MKKYIYFISAMVLGIMLNSCNKKFEQYSVNPNEPSVVPPSQLLRTIEGSMYIAPFGQEERNNQFTLSNYNYYDDNAYWDGVFHSQYASLNYPTLTNVQNMVSSANAAADTTLNPYDALGKFFKAYFFVSMTMKVGDLPMTDALTGLQNLTPKYDTQKAIFLQSLKWLDSANTEMATVVTNLSNGAVYEFSGDSYFADALGTNAAIIEWQKAINTFRLRVLIELSHHADDADLNVPAQFAMILGNPAQYPIMTGMSDNVQYTYNTQYNNYPNNNLVYGTQTLRYNMAAAYEDSVASFHDLRVMMVSEPARGLGHPDTSYSSYRGANAGLPLSTMGQGVTSNSTNLYSLIGRHRYYETLVGEPTFIISYPEMCFNIAEGINRGWASGDATQWYQNGILADFGFYGVKDGANQVILQKPNGALGSDTTYTVNFSYTDYMNQPLVKYAGNNARGQEQILEQKYLAFFRNTGMEAYYQWRRTGVPGFLQGPDQSGYGNGGTIPLRFQYPLDEVNSNSANYMAAIQSQYGGTDAINAKMWLIQ
jgi:hypothetical protein